MKARRILVPVGLVSTGLGVICAVRLALPGPGQEGPDANWSVETASLAPPAETTPLLAAARSEASAGADAREEAAAVAERATSRTDSATLEVRVVSVYDHEPVPGVRLSLRPSRGGFREDLGTLLSDGNGAATNRTRSSTPLVLEADGRWVGVQDGSVEIEALAAGSRRTVEVRLETSARQRYFGRVVDAETGAPLAGASAQLLLGTPGALGIEADEELLASAPCDQDGLFSFWVADFGRDLIQIEHAGHANALVQVMGGHETSDTASVVELPRAASVAAVLEESSGEPAAEVEVVLRARLRDLAGNAESAFFLDGRDRTWRARTDARGMVTMHGLPPGVPLDLTLARANRVLLQERGFELLPGQLARLERAIGAGATIRGLLPEHDGSPASGVEVWLTHADGPQQNRFFRSAEREGISRRTTTSALGRFTFRGVGPGDWWVGPAPQDEARVASHPGQALAPAATRVTVGEGQAEQDLTLEVHRGHFVRGMVVDPDGQPLAAVRVGHWSRGLWVRTDEEGRFQFGPLLPLDYLLQAATPGSASHAASETISVPAGTTDLVLQLRPGASIRGKTVDAVTGEPVAAEVRLVAADHRTAGFRLMHLRSDRTGTFFHQGLLPGEYQVVATTPGSRIGVSEPLLLEAGERREDLELALGPAARLHVAIEGGADEYFTFEVLVGQTTISMAAAQGNGESVVTVPPGVVRVVPVGGMLRTVDEQSVRVSLGEEARVTFTLDD